MSERRPDVARPVQLDTTCVARTEGDPESATLELLPRGGNLAASLREERCEPSVTHGAVTGARVENVSGQPSSTTSTSTLAGAFTDGAGGDSRR